MRPLTRRLGTTLAALVLLAGAACSGTDQAIEAKADSAPRDVASGAQTPAAAGATTATEAVRAAAEAPSRMGSVTMEMTISVDGEEFSRMSGVTTSDGTASDLTMSTPMGEIRTLMVDGAFYMQMPEMPDGFEWISLPLDEVTGLTGMDPAAARGEGSPTKMLEALAEFSEITEIGTDTLFGVPVTGYRATISSEDALAHGMGSISDDLAGEMAEILPESYDIDVWIDEDGLPRRQAWSMEMPTTPGAPLSTFAYTIDFTDWADAVEITAPAPETVATMSDLMSMAD